VVVVAAPAPASMARLLMFIAFLLVAKADVAHDLSLRARLVC
jgi:archaellum component FlaG (FlaF/FlaG flagellin family)